MSDWVTLQNALGLTLRPIHDWPGKLRYDRDRSPYSAPLKDTLTILKRELSALSARQIVLQIAFREGDFRQDGLPRANAVATHPGVILAFESSQGPLRLHFDGFTRYEHNLRAIAMHLADLRHASLYGVGADGQQYAGWKALPPPKASAPSTPFASVQEAAKWMSRWSSWGPVQLLSNSLVARQAYNAASLKLHPDTSGDHESFVRLQQAKSLLDQYHKEMR